MSTGTAPAAIGFVGLGMMGLPMVRHLATAPGLRDLAHDAVPARLETLRAHPAWGTSLLAAPALQDLAGCEVVITMLPDSTITNRVVAGLLPVLSPGSVVVDMGSSNPADTAALAQQLAAAGITLLDAPVSGSVAKAGNGTLSIMVGGDEDVYLRVKPVLECLGSAIIRTGAVGSAHAMKALNNYVYAAGLLALSEALVVAGKLGLDLEVFSDVLNASSGRNVATETKLRQFMLPRDFKGGFALGLQAKDLQTARSLQQASDVNAPQLELCAALWREAVAQLGPAADNTAILTFLEGRAPS